MLCTNACTDNVPSSPAPINQAETDSITAWVANGRSTKNTNEDRLAYLQKAEALANSTDNDSLKSKYFSKISLAYLRLNDSLRFRKTNTFTRRLAIKIGDSVCQAETHWDLAIFLRGKVADSAYYHFAAAQELFGALDEESLSGRMYYNMALVQNDVRDYTGSEINTIKAIELLKPHDAYSRLYHCYNNLARIARSFKEYDLSLTYHQEALEYLEKSGSQGTLEMLSKNNIGTVYVSQGDFKTAKTYFEEVVNFDSLYYKDTETYALALNNLARSKFKLNDTTELPELFLKTMKIQDSVEDVSNLAFTNFNLAEYYLKQQDTTLALNYMQTAHDLSKQSSNYFRLLETLKILPKADPKNTAKYVQEYIALNDSLQTAERKIRNKFARIRFETDEVVAENALLARQRQLWTGIAAALLLLGFASIVIFNQRTKNQRLKFQQAQQASNQEIFNLMLVQGEKIEEGKQMEQKRISEELHDGVQGRLQGARMMLLGLNARSDDDAVSERKRAILMLKEIQEEVRSISHELSHAAYQKIHNFILSLEDLISTIKSGADIEIDFTYSEQLDWDTLSGDIKINLYRMIQEIIQNSIKHAECKKIQLDLQADVSSIRTTITDDGKGFVVKKGRKGIGMRNIASRMTKVNGTWDIDSTLGKGTKTTMVIPIAINEDDASINNTKEVNLQEST